MRLVDLRSDTLTLPDEEMRRRMAGAGLGDDVFGEDPSVNDLERLAADRLGKEAAVLVASGTMANLIGVLCSARSGEEIIADADSHLFLAEAAGAAMVGGIQIRPLPTERGVLSAGQVEAAVRPRNDTHQPRTAAVCLENTHNRQGGTVWPLENLAAVRSVADRHGLAVHMDGARVFNAAVAMRLDVREISAYADTVCFCISKGLGCPVGSLLCGTEETIEEARRWRKMLGGGWRQAGVLAAAGVYALESMVDRLAEDHANARTLAEGLAEIDGLSVDLARVQTNLVFADLRTLTAADFVAGCAERGVRAGRSGPQRVRFVTHFGIEPEDIQRAIQVSSEVLAGAGGLGAPGAVRSRGG